jgi:hypothetical protein
MELESMALKRSQHSFNLETAQYVIVGIFQHALLYHHHHHHHHQKEENV